ncbi:methionine/alanine import family NSS transporter small subunit [Hoyosella subflava]|uniref:Uncharacterized protein n=1 Tax=Hoyosella subflava (strain DSM 45089 / JCM 17490 / NBRC 109087 / DQS3-9A1) TaxID=443218 RepID=F6EM28_HOYSD|nr:methionine/alanine import family NSS transporter small subunit [Hoyosella subflava]AEF42809.1 hypothetical protein AS9A_4376 [Hoyosella subflava DQS3-9A1]
MNISAVIMMILSFGITLGGLAAALRHLQLHPDEADNE